MDDASGKRSTVAQWLRSRWLRYAVFALLAGAYLGVNQRLNNLHLPAWMSFVWEYSSVLAIVALIPFVIRFERHFPIDSRPRGRIIAAHLMGMILFSTAHIVGFVMLRKLAFAVAGESYEFGDIPLRGLYEGQKDAIFYLMILLLVFAAREFRVRRAEALRVVELATELSTARLQHLTAQIEPHFLFNKPFDRDRFMQSVVNVREALAEPDRSDLEERMRRLLAGAPGRTAPVKRILIRGGGRGFFLAVNDIQRIAAAGNYVEVHTRDKVHLVRESLSAFIAQLDPAEFLRVHRSHVVRTGFIAELRPTAHGDYELLLKDGQRVGLSRRYKQLLPPEIRERI